MRKIYITSCFVVLLLISFLSITYSYEYNENFSLTFELVGDYKLNLFLHDEYVEYGVKVLYNEKDISSLVKIDDSMVDMNRVGVYKVKYEVIIDGICEYVYRLVSVIDNIKPQIMLDGDNMVYINLGDEYIEPGYNVTDNYDIDLFDKVNVTTNLDVNNVGMYEIEYSVMDSSGNTSVVKRVVIVK